MIEFSARFSRLLRPELAADELASGAEAALGGAGRIGGGFLFATAATGASALEIGRVLAERWPEAVLMGSSFQGVLAQGRVWREEPAAGLLVWAQGPVEPIPVIFDPADVVIEHLAHDLLEAAGCARFTSRDLLLLFPDALASSGLEALLADLIPRLGEPSVVGAAASGLAGASLAWFGGEEQPAATVGLGIPGGALVSGTRVQCAGASRFASPWLQIDACRARWVDRLDGEPPLDWVRRQLGLEAAAPVEPYLDRLLVRLRDESPREAEGADRIAATDAAGDDFGDFVERYVVGVDDRRGSISVPGALRRGGQLAFALPDPDRAREALRAAVGALPPSSLLMQFACRARDEALYGDVDLESALVAHSARDRAILGTVAPFQLGPDARGRCRVLVHATVLAALGDR